MVVGHLDKQVILLPWNIRLDDELIVFSHSSRYRLDVGGGEPSRASIAPHERSISRSLATGPLRTSKDAPAGKPSTSALPGCVTR